MYYSRPYHTQERGRSKVGGGSHQHNNPDDSTSKVLNNFSKALGKIFISILLYKVVSVFVCPEGSR